MKIQRCLRGVSICALALGLASCAMTKMDLQQTQDDAKAGKPVSTLIDVVGLPLMMFSDVITAPFQGMTPDQVEQVAQQVAPGSVNNPNAIVDAANAQGARMIAVGQANDAARQARFEAQQRQDLAETRRQEEATQQQQEEREQQTQPVAMPTGGAAQSPSDSQGTNDSCTDMNGAVTGKVWVGTDGIVAGSLTNTSGQPLSVHYTFAKGGQPDPNQAGVLTLQPGQTRGGELSGIWATATSVDNPPRIFWSAVPASDANKSCGMRNPW